MSGGKSGIVFSASHHRRAVASEIELRFAIPPGDLRRLARMPRLSGFEAGIPAAQRMSSLYYDTPGLRLAKAGWTLRVRKVKGRVFQTAKRELKNALGLERAEYECELDAEIPDIGWVPDASARHTLFALVGSKPLTKILAADVSRTVRSLKTESGAEIEMALDRGKIRTLVRRDEVLPICSLELELKKGEQPVLFDAARFLAGDAELALDVESKSQKGLRAIAGEAGKTSKAGRVELHCDATVEEAFATSLVHCLRHIARNFGAVAHGGDAEGVHQLRVALRRLRVALSAAGKPFRTHLFKRLRAEAKTFASTLGETRDLDVFAQDMLAPVEKALGKTRLKVLREALSAARRKFQRHVTGVARSPGFLRFLIDLAAAVHTREWREGASARDSAYFQQRARDIAGEVLAKRLRQTRKCARELSSLDDEERHELRLAIKKLRYTAEFFAPLFASDKVLPYLSELGKLQDQFGALNDAANTGDILAKIAPHIRRRNMKSFERSRDTVVEWHQARMPQIWEKAQRRWKRFEKLKPFWE